MKTPYDNISESKLSLAEIYRQGYEAGKRDNVGSFEAGVYAGRREIVNWIKRANQSGDFYYSFDQAQLQAKLKEWGIDE